jgi:hypothetical protein
MFYIFMTHFLHLLRRWVYQLTMFANFHYKELFVDSLVVKFSNSSNDIVRVIRIELNQVIE